MTAVILDGRALAREIRSECRERVVRLKETWNVTPGLAVLLVGDDAASLVYVRNKIRVSAEVGLRSELIRFSESVSSEELIGTITRLNGDPDVHGILVQLPLPQHLDIRSILGAITIEKDVDAFHLYNVGGLVIGETTFSPCTPYGVMKILDHAGIGVEGKNVVIVGASNIVGKPMALMMIRREATVSICHAKTRDLAQYTILADILIVAAGVPNLILPQMVKTGAVVIDVGINRLPDGTIVGDVDFEGLVRKTAFITPVPGGVGPMTVTMLLSNTISAAERIDPQNAIDPAVLILRE